MALQTEVSFRSLYVDAPTFDDTWSVVSGFGFAMSGSFPITMDGELRLVRADCVAVREQ